MSAQPDSRLRHLFEVVQRADRAIRLYNLRDRAERREWERVAYEPRLDYGEAAGLKPNAHIENDCGWMD